MKNKKLHNIVVDTYYNDYKQAKGKPRKSKAEKIVLLLIMNICIYGYLFGVMDQKHSFVIKAQVIEEASASSEASEIPNPCALKDVVCEGEGKAALTRAEAPNEAKDHIVALIIQEFGSEARTAIAIAKAESHLNPNAKGDTRIEFTQDGITMGHSCGVFQIRVLPGRPDCETLKDPEFNIKYAKKLFDRSGFTPWSTFNNGKYIKFM